MNVRRTGTDSCIPGNMYAVNDQIKLHPICFYPTRCDPVCFLVENQVSNKRLSLHARAPYSCLLSVYFRDLCTSIYII